MTRFAPGFQLVTVTDAEVVCVMHLTMFTRRYRLSISAKEAACGAPALETV